MKPLLLPHASKLSLVLSTLLLVGSQAWAQASAPRHQGYGTGYHARQMGGTAATGRTLMTPTEREAHRTAIAATTSLEECRLLQSQQRQQLSERALARGMAEPTPRRDACATKQP